MTSLDRFQAPAASEDNRATCANCGAEDYTDKLDYDENFEHYLCGRTCFDEWHDANHEAVGDFYWRMNISY